MEKANRLVYVDRDTAYKAHEIVFWSEFCWMLVFNKSMGWKEKSPGEPEMIRSGESLLLREDRISQLSGLVKKIARFIWFCLKVGKTFCIPSRVGHWYFHLCSDVAQSPRDNWLAYKGFFCSQSVFLQCQAQCFPQTWQPTYGCLETQENSLIQPQWRKSEAGLVYFAFWIG